jgi:hypothetical protein
MALLSFSCCDNAFQLRSRSRESGNVIETHEHSGDFREAS